MTMWSTHSAFSTSIKNRINSIRASEAGIKNYRRISRIMGKNQPEYTWMSIFQSPEAGNSMYRLVEKGITTFKSVDKTCRILEMRFS